MKKLLWLGFLFWSSAACNPIKGTLKVSSPLTFKIAATNNCNEEFDWWNCQQQDESYKVSSGIYDANLLVKSKSQVDLEIKSSSGKIKSIPIELPKGSSFPEYSGKLHLTSKQLGQSFALDADVSTGINDTETYDSVEQCSKAVQRKVCEWVEVRDNSKKDHRDREERRKGKDRENSKRYVCEYKTEYVPGEMDVSYYYRTTTTEVELIFLKANSQTPVGLYTGAKSDTDKIYTYKGSCQINRLHHNRW